MQLALSRITIGWSVPCKCKIPHYVIRVKSGINTEHSIAQDRADISVIFILKYGKLRAWSNLSVVSRLPDTTLIHISSYPGETRIYFDMQSSQLACAVSLGDDDDDVALPPGREYLVIHLMAMCSICLSCSQCVTTFSLFNSHSLHAGVM